MATKRISRARKRDLQDPDEFITFWTKLFNFSAEHKVQVFTGLAFLSILIIVTVVTVFVLRKSENNAIFLYQQGVAKYQTLVKSGNPNKAYLEVAKDFERIMEKYSARKGGKLARFTYAEMCYAAGDYDKAVTYFKKSLVDFNEEPFLKNLILSGLGYSYKAKKDYNTSAKYFEMIVTTPDDSIKDEALFNLGELYAAIGDKDKSLEAYNKILSDHSGSMYTEIVKEKVAWHPKR